MTINGNPEKEVSTPRPTPPVLPTGRWFGEYDENGVDVSLLHELLRLSPLERLRRMERHARDTKILNEYGRRHREATARAGG